MANKQKKYTVELDDCESITIESHLGLTKLAEKVQAARRNDEFVIFGVEGSGIAVIANAIRVICLDRDEEESAT